MLSVPVQSASIEGRTYQSEKAGMFRYIISSGDTFYQLSQKFGTNLSWLESLNRELDPYDLQIGEEILVSKEAEMDYKLVESGDTLWAISQRYGVGLDELIELNRLENADYIQPGEIIFLYPAEYIAEADQIKIREMEHSEDYLYLSGLARVFEATVNYALETADGEVVKKGLRTATTGGPGWGEFVIEIEEFPDEADYLAVFNISAKDGSRENEIKLEL